MDAKALSTKVLLVDDTPTHLRTLAAALRDEYQLVVATDGATALELARREAPDLVLLDILMPGMDGYEVCRQMKSDPELDRIPVIFITGKDEDADEILGLELGAVDYITKPFSLAIVRARVKTHLELKRYRDLLEDLLFMDELTTLPNRRRFDTFLDFTWRQSIRQEAPLSVIFVEVERYKELGQEAGNANLLKISRALDGQFRRATDLVARYAPEKFGIILPGTNLEGAQGLAEKIQRALDALAVLAPPAIAVTLGVGSLNPGPEDLSSRVLEEAGRDLFRNRHGLRNQAEA